MKEEDIEYSQEKAEELREWMGTHSLPDVAAAADITLADVEKYATGAKRITRAVWKKLARALNQLDFERENAPGDWSKVGCPDEVEFAAYKSGSPKNVGIAVRFSEKEWERVVKLFPPDTDIEKCVRAFILNGLRDEVLRMLYVPQRYKEVPGGFDAGGEDGLNERFLFERDGCRVVIELAEGELEGLMEDGEEGVFSNQRRLFAEHVFMTEYDRRANGAVFDSEWKERAIEAEAKLDGIGRILRSKPMQE